MSKHTCGPWLMELDNFGDYTIHPQHEALAIAAVVNGEMRRMGGLSGEHEANAHLIVSAPDLYEALHDLLTRPTDGTARVRARAALDKAEGRRHA